MKVSAFSDPFLVCDMCLTFSITFSYYIEVNWSFILSWTE